MKYVIFAQFYLSLVIMKNKKYSWIYKGVFFGLFMFVFMGILFPLADKETLAADKLGKTLVFWLIGGLITQISIDFFESRLAGKKDKGEIKV